MTHRRVVITGIGAITPIGCGAAGLWSGTVRGESAVRSITRFDARPFRSQLAAEVDDDLFDADAYLDGKRARRLDRFSTFAVISALQAVADAELERCSLGGAGCYLGSALGGIAFAEQQHDRYVRGGFGSVEPILAQSVFGGAGPANIAIELGLHGPCGANSNSCASGAIAIGEAFRLIRDGELDVMLAGGVEVPLAPLSFGAFAMIKAMSTQTSHPENASRPFDRCRDGFVMGEGAAILVLEALEHANARGARMYAEVRGFGRSNDAYHMLAPRPDGSYAAQAIRSALRDARVQPTAIDYVNAHASGTPLGDRAEAVALKNALCFAAGEGPLVSGTKGLYGHPLGASGAIETAILAMALARGHLPGTANLEQPDSDNPLRLIGPDGACRRADLALKTAFGFGGINAALVLGAIQPTEGA